MIKLPHFFSAALFLVLSSCTQLSGPREFQTDGTDLTETQFPNVLSGHQNPITEVEDWEYRHPHRP